MANKKVTTMVLKVSDLQCSCCYKKIKKILCKFPQIKNQVYDDNQNTVTITVVCCNPEKIRDKLSCKGGKVIKSIEIKEPAKPKPKDTEKKPKDIEKKPKEIEKPKESEKHKTPVLVPVGYLPLYAQGPCCGPCSEGYSGGPCYHGYGRPPPPPPRPCYDGYGYGYGPYGCSCGCGGTRGCYVNTQYFCEENSSRCTIMRRITFPYSSA